LRSFKCSFISQEAELPQRNSASAAHVYAGWPTYREVIVQRCSSLTNHSRCCTTWLR